MSKARLTPVYLVVHYDPDFVAQTRRLRELLAGVAEIADPMPRGAQLPDADGLVFPQMTVRRTGASRTSRRLGLPILVLRHRSSARWRCGTGRSSAICGQRVWR